MNLTKRFIIAGTLAAALVSSASQTEARESSAYPDATYDFMLFVRDWNAEPDAWILVDTYETFQEAEDAAHYYAGTWVWEVDLVPLYNPPRQRYWEGLLPIWWRR